MQKGVIDGFYPLNTDVYTLHKKQESCISPEKWQTKI